MIQVDVGDIVASPDGLHLICVPSLDDPESKVLTDGDTEISLDSILNQDGWKSDIPPDVPKLAVLKFVLQRRKREIPHNQLMWSSEQANGHRGH